MAAVKDKLVKLIAINLAKQKCGDPSKSDQFYIEAEDLFKDLLLRMLIATLIITMSIISRMKYWSRDILNSLLFLLKNSCE